MNQQDSERGPTEELPRQSSRRSIGLTLASAILIGIASLGSMAAAQNQQIEFWSQAYGDQVAYRMLLEELASDFRQETGIAVQIELVNWSNAFPTWLAVAQGGPAPDVADMYWLHSFSAIGGDEYGPMPINEYKDEYWPDLEERFYPGSLQDVIWQGDFYGIPWRGDIRPMIYRTDLFAEAGLAGPPETWDEITEHAIRLTERDANGNVTQWGFTFGGGNTVTQLFPYYWQAGGEFLSEDGRTATIDNEAMRTTLEWMRALVWEHEVVTPEFMDQSYVPQTNFIAGSLAMVGNASDEWGAVLEREYPELDGKWAMAQNAAGPEDRDTFSGAGYWGVLRGSDNVEESVRWIAYLSRDENMQRLAEALGRVSPNRVVMTSDYWSGAPWREVVADSLEFGHTSQEPAPSWSTLATPQPGAVLYDMFYDAIVGRQDIDEVLARAEQRMQAELDRTAP